MTRISAKSAKAKGVPKKAITALDTGSEKKSRGRHKKVTASWVRGRADNYRWILAKIWEQIGGELPRAQTTKDVVSALESPTVAPYGRGFVDLADLILKVVRDPKFPQRTSREQINFLADSIAGHGSVSPRYSRDLCEKERAKTKASAKHRILHYEFWIECSCRYKGRSQDHACPKCGAQIRVVSGATGSVFGM